MEDVLKQISTIQLHKASGFPLIASKIWKLVLTEFVQILTCIFNHSVDWSFPRSMEDWNNNTHPESVKSI